MKFLCVCAGGNIRSRAMAYIMMERHKQDALSAGALYQPDTIAHLAATWADRIIVMEPKFLEVIPFPLRGKARVNDVGHDTYGTPWNFILIDRCAGFAKEWAARNFAL